MSGATGDPRLLSDVAVHSELEMLCHIWISQGCTGNEVLDSSTTVKLIYRDQLSFGSMMEDGGLLSTVSGSVDPELLDLLW